MKALGTFVVINPAEVETETPGGIVIPENAQTAEAIGTVENVGGNVELDVVQGDVVAYRKYGAQPVSNKIVVEQKDLLAVLEV